MCFHLPLFPLLQESRSEVSHPEPLSEESMLVHPSGTESETLQMHTQTQVVLNILLHPITRTPVGTGVNQKIYLLLVTRRGLSYLCFSLSPTNTCPLLFETPCYVSVIDYSILFFISALCLGQPKYGGEEND